MTSQATGRQARYGLRLAPQQHLRARSRGGPTPITARTPGTGILA